MSGPKDGLRAQTSSRNQPLDLCLDLDWSCFLHETLEGIRKGFSFLTKVLVFLTKILVFSTNKKVLL